jgi:hypothetical protein
VREASELQKIVSVAERLSEELGHAEAATDREDQAIADDERLRSWGSADVENAQLVARLSRALARIAAAASTQAEEEAEADPGVATALARTELVIRGELLRGDEAALRKQLPVFVFLVVLPGAGLDRALELADRARDLLEEDS